MCVFISCCIVPPPAAPKPKSNLRACSLFWYVVSMFIVYEFVMLSEGFNAFTAVLVNFHLSCNDDKLFYNDE